MNGWVLASFDEGDRIIKTEDEGQTWSAFDSTYSFLNRIDFVNNMTGFVFSGNGILKSIDGGQTWNTIEGSPDSNTDMYVLNENDIWVTWGLAYQYSTDGGITWSEHSSTGFGGHTQGVFALDKDNV
jgi:photosystem II stability/assembly factor-like uncharacterized protein